MKKVILLSFLPIFTSSISVEPIENDYEKEIKQPIVELDRKDIPDVITDEHLVSALIFVESRGNDSAIGDRHLVGNEAVGALQIRPIMLREVNRILKLQGIDKRFKLNDRYSREKTIEMFYIWKNYYHKNSTHEEIARTWNGGPRGAKSSRTIKYWNKVEQQLNNKK